MPNLLEILLVLQPEFSGANVIKLSEIITTILRLSSPVTTRAIGRVSKLGLRSIERFYAQKPLDWTFLRVLLFKSYIFKPEDTYLLVLDETTEKKSGKSSYGLDFFYSSLAKKSIPSVSFLGASLVSTSTEKSHFLSCKQLVKTEEYKKNKKDKNKKNKTKKQDIGKPKGKAGRPKGSKNKGYTEPKSLSFQTFIKLVDELLAQLQKYCLGLKLPYLVLDGFYGNQHYLKYAKTKKLSIISKLKCNANLMLAYQGEQKKGRGRPKKYDKKLDYTQIPDSAKVNLPKEHLLNKKNINVWALQVYDNSIKDCLIQVVIIEKINTKTKQIARTLLFSNDLNLDPLLLIKYYSLRFQIEFDFRDAKQFFGLSDFKNYKEKQLTNAVNIAFTCKICSQILLEKYKKELNNEKLSITDLKALQKAEMYYYYFLNTSENKQKDFLNHQIFLNIVKLNAVNIK